jgi:hypothetical protein
MLKMVLGSGPGSGIKRTASSDSFWGSVKAQKSPFCLLNQFTYLLKVLLLPPTTYFSTSQLSSAHCCDTEESQMAWNPDFPSAETKCLHSFTSVYPIKPKI